MRSFVALLSQKPHKSHAEAANASGHEDIVESQIESVRTWSSATTTDGSLGSQSSKPSRPSNYRAFQSIRDEVLGFIDRSMGLRLGKEDTVAAHELKKGQNDTFPPLIVRFAFTSIKQDMIMEEFRKWRLFKQRIYINDQLTAINNKIFYHARSVVKNNTIQSAWTRLGKIYIHQAAHDKPVWVQNCLIYPSKYFLYETIRKCRYATLYISCVGIIK